MEKISNRHESDLGGRFLPFTDTEPTVVTIVVPASLAHLPAVQHTAWMVINLLCRFEGVLSEVCLSCPAGVQLAGRVVPLAERDQDLRTALVAGAKAIGIVPLRTNRAAGRVLAIGGSSEPVSADLFLYANGWTGGISTTPLAQADTSSPLPIGPYIAASLAASEVFKAVRMQADSYRPVTRAFYNAWNHHGGTDPDWTGPAAVPDVTLDLALAGVGAVGCAWMHALWAFPNLGGQVLLADNDPKGIEATNLNRYILFGRQSIGKPKASEGAHIVEDAGIEWCAQDTAVEKLSPFPARIVSAVDTNRARMAIQQRYPSWVLSGSTKELRAEVMRIGPPGVGACLRCYNPPEELTPDAELRGRFRHASAEELARLAAEVGLTLNEATDWIEQGRCGMAGERLLPHLRLTDGAPGRFAVSFVSAMAGTLLAAETVKDAIGSNQPLSISQSRAVFQLWQPTAPSNSASVYLRDNQCPMCRPGTEAVRIWRARQSGVS